MSRAMPPAPLDFDPPSAPDTPSEMPGTPNSTTTSLSTLSTTAIKDGHRGHNPLSHHHQPHQFPSSGSSFPYTYPSTNTLEAERADRISRLAGLERVRPGQQSGSMGMGGAGGTGGGMGGGQILPGYFDAQGNPVYQPRTTLGGGGGRSTVGSASATDEPPQTAGTWASGSTHGGTRTEGTEGGDNASLEGGYEGDTQMGEGDRDERDNYSAQGRSDDGDRDGDAMSDNTEGSASLVGFGEGAGSTVSGPIYTRTRPLGPLGPMAPGGAIPGGTAPGSGAGASAAGGGTEGGDATVGVAAAERIVRERLDDGEGKEKVMSTPDESGAGLGRFYFERK